MNRRQSYELQRDQIEASLSKTVDEIRKLIAFQIGYGELSTLSAQTESRGESVRASAYRASQYLH